MAAVPSESAPLPPLPPLITMSGWGLNSQVFSKLPTNKHIPLHWEQYLMLSPIEQAAALSAALTSAPAPALVLGLSLGAFLVYGAVYANRHHPRLAGAAFFAIAESYLQTKTNPYGAKLDSLRGMVRSLQTGDAAAETTLLADFVAACWAADETPADAGAALLMSPGPQRTASLLRALGYLQTVTLRNVPSISSKPCCCFHGTEDLILHHRAGEAFAAARAHGYDSVAGAGHLLPFTAASVVTARLRLLAANS